MSTISTFFMNTFWPAPLGQLMDVTAPSAINIVPFANGAVHDQISPNGAKGFLDKLTDGAKNRGIHGGLFATPPFELKHAASLSEYRRLLDKTLLKSDNPRSAAFRKRMEQKGSTVAQWLYLSDHPTIVKVPTASLATVMEKRFNDSLSALEDIWKLTSNKGSRDQLKRILMSLGFGVVIETDSGKENLKLVFLQETISFSDRQIAVFRDFLEELRSEGIAISDNLKNILEHFEALVAISKDYLILKGKEFLEFKIVLLPRSPKFIAPFKLQPSSYSDLSIHVLGVCAPNGDVLGAVALRLFQNDHGKPLLFYSVLQPPPHLHHWHTKESNEATNEKLKSISQELGLGKDQRCEVYSVEKLTWGQGPIPATDPFGSEETVRKIDRGWKHHHHDLLLIGNSSYEAMRPFKDGTIVHLNPWLGPNFPMPRPYRGSIDDLLMREIDPEPDIGRPNQYTFGLSQDTGRSVDYSVDFVTPDGTRWHHLNAIGVGKTYKTRCGIEEERDGLLGLDEAYGRFYLTNAMHAVAARFGFRTSLGVAVIDRKKFRKNARRLSGLAQTQAISFELRREQLRLDDLENVPSVRETVDYVKAKIAKELGLKEMSDMDYVRWLARTIGEQYAIMIFFGFDHGVGEGQPQLFPWNISLAGEIFDFETARFAGSQNKGFEDRYFAINEVSIGRIKELEEGYRKKDGEINWLSILLGLCPSLHFKRIVWRGFRTKWNELKKSGIDPRAEIARFNREMWVPYMKGRQ